MKLRIAGLLLFLSVSPFLQSQTTSQQEVVVPYWTSEPGWNTHIEIRNNRRDRAVTVTPTLRLASGREVPLSPITVDTAESKPVNVGLALAAIMSANAESAPMFGSVILRFDGGSPSNIFAAAIVRRVGYPIAFHFDALATYESSIPGTRETLWLLPTKAATTYVVVTNTSRKGSSARFLVSEVSGESVAVDRTIGPGQSARISVREVLPDLPENAMGSVSVSMADSSPDFTVIAFAYDDSTGFSAVSKVFERDPSEKVAQITLRAPMVALRQPSPALSFPADTQLQPRILLRNASNSAVTPQIAIRWKAPDSTGMSAIDSATIQPGQLRVISLNDDAKPAIPANADWAGVSIQYSGRHGDLVPITASYDESGRYGTQTPFSATVATRWEGGVWHAGAPMNNTVMTVGNGGEQGATALLTLNLNGGKQHYEIERRLGPGEQMWIDIGELIRTQAPDRNGTTLPPETTQGTYSIRDLDRKVHGFLFEGKINIDRTHGHAMYGCGLCCGYFPPVMVPSSSTVAVGGAGFTQEIQATDSCWGWDIDMGGENWSSTNSSVVAVSNGVLTGVSPGNVTVNAYVDYDRSFGGCPPVVGHPGSGSTSLQVQVTTADIVSDQIAVSLSPSGLTGTLTVVTEGTTYQVYSGTKTSGTYTFAFNRPSLPVGQYSAVKATWTVNSQPASGSKSVAFLVMGTYRHSRYNTPDETACTGAQAAAYKTNPNPSCTFTPVTLKSDFISQSWLNGSGKAIDFGIEQNEAYCMTHGTPPADANERSFRPQAIVPYCTGYSVSDSTVAKGDGAPLVCGDSVLILGPTAVTKTVTDRCAACGSLLQLDNYTTQAACTPGSIPDYGTYKTIRLR
ncbi:MAG: hypothetical protein M3P27_11195 [Acidobacteriota bacterium]|nr:hypothetical protein [Acidobacteriota bacterium]